MNSSNLTIGRGWSVVSSDGKRVGDVTEVHPHYLLVSRGVILVKDIYLPLGTVDRTETNRVILTVTYDTLKRMDLSHEPPPVAIEEPTLPLHDPAPADYTSDSLYQGDATVAGEPVPYTDPWQSGESVSYDEMPTYNRPTPNGLVEVESGLNLGFQDLSYGPSVVLLQGWPFDDTVWEPLPGILAADHRIVSYDPRGVGRSDRPWDYYSVEIMANDLHRLMVEQSLLRCDTGRLVERRAGGPALRRRAPRTGGPAGAARPADPALADRSGAGRGARQPERAGRRDPGTLGGGTAGRSSRSARAADRSAHRRTAQRPEAPLAVAAADGRCPARPGQDLGGPAQLRPGIDAPSEVKAPVTIISGEQDRLSPPALAAHLASLLPRAQTVVLGECGHAAFLDQRETVVRMIRDLTGAAETARAMEEALAEADVPWADAIEAGAEGTAELAIPEEGETNAPTATPGLQNPAPSSADAGTDRQASVPKSPEIVAAADANSAR